MAISFAVWVRLASSGNPTPSSTMTPSQRRSAAGVAVCGIASAYCAPAGGLFSMSRRSSAAAAERPGVLSTATRLVYGLTR